MAPVGAASDGIPILNEVNQDICRTNAVGNCSVSAESDGIPVLSKVDGRLSRWHCWAMVLVSTPSEEISVALTLMDIRRTNTDAKWHQFQLLMLES